MTTPIKWGDAQQYHAEPHANYAGPTMGVLPEVTLLWMTPDPLGAMAAHSAIYEGRVVRSLNDVTDEDRLRALADVQKTHLQAPLEAVKFHFLIEGVDRAFTHQLVRQRTANYAQESLRFAVPGALHEATTLPPSLQGTEDARGPAPNCDLYGIMQSKEFGLLGDAQKKRVVWDYMLGIIDFGYHWLVDHGMPAEEARGQLPTAVATRIHYETDLRNLQAHAGNRLCTQAQFHWRLVFTKIVHAIKNYGNNDDNCYTLPTGECVGTGLCMHSQDRWQFSALAESKMFRPVCYQLGHCPFKASFDRECAIRSRVDRFAKRGVPSDQWHKGHHHTEFKSGDDYGYQVHDDISGIKTEEWLMNPAAARVVD